MGAAPVITTDRLILRPHTADDFGACCALWADPTVVRFIGGRPSTPEEVWARLLRYAGLWSLCDYGYLLATDRATGALVGEFGLADFQRSIEPALGDAPEAGWALLPAWHGRGLAREALIGLLDWAGGQGLTRTVCLIDPANAPSLRLAAGLGYREYARSTYKDAPTILLERQH